MKSTRASFKFLAPTISKISIMQITYILLYLELVLSVSIKNEDGCPYTFDMGNQGYNYTKPQSCFTLLPENYTTAPRNKPYQNNGSTWGEPSPLDPFIVRMMYTAKPEEFLVRIDSVDESTNVHELYVEVRRISRKGKLGKRIGFFEGQTDYEGFCCEDSKLQCMFHRPPIAGAPTSTTSIRWIPLRFPSGEVIIRANVFLTADEWYANITSRRYVFPGWGISQRETAVRYTVIPNPAFMVTGRRRGKACDSKECQHSSALFQNHF